jgi:hypothetical protein
VESVKIFHILLKNTLLSMEIFAVLQQKEKCFQEQISFQICAGIGVKEITI